MFASEEAEEEIKRESAKIVHVETPSTQEVAKEEQTPKPSAPTPEQILAIKVYNISFLLRILVFSISSEDQHEKLRWGKLTVDIINMFIQ